MYRLVHMYRLVLISLPHSLKSKVRLLSYWIGRWGRPCGVRTSDHAITPSNGSRHYGGPYTTGDNIQSDPEGQVFPGIVTLPPPPARTCSKKPVTIPRNTLTNLTETSTWREADTRTRTTTRHPTRRRITHLIPNKKNSREILQNQLKTPKNQLA